MDLSVQLSYGRRVRKDAVSLAVAGIVLGHRFVLLLITLYRV